MLVIVVIILLALLLGGLGLLVKGLLWLILIAVILFIVGAALTAKALRK